jgi:hypothetical protein
MSATVTRIKPGCQVSLMRSELPTLLASELPNFIFHNPGLVIKTMGQRACVIWRGYPSMWFDFEALTKGNA